MKTREHILVLASMIEVRLSVNAKVSGDVNDSVIGQLAPLGCSRYAYENAATTRTGRDRWLESTTRLRDDETVCILVKARLD